MRRVLHVLFCSVAVSMSLSLGGCGLGYKIDYGQFRSYLENGRIKSAVLKDCKITGSFSDEYAAQIHYKKFRTTMPQRLATDPQELQYLRKRLGSRLTIERSLVAIDQRGD